MILGILTFVSALTISAIAIYYSVAGLAAIFAAAVIPIIIMGVALEVGKLVTAVWLHRNWNRAVWWLKGYLATAVFILMFITSMGIFGFLSKAHIEQTSMSQEQVALIDTLNDKETRSQAKIERWRSELDRLAKGEDVRVDTLIEKEQEGLDKIYARIKNEKDGLRADAQLKIDQQQLRITQAQDRRDAEIAAAEKKFAGSFAGSKEYEEAVNKAKQNELSVASRAQKEILAVNKQLDADLDAVDSKYTKDIADINKRINDLRNQANSKTVDIEGRITELEGFIEGEQKVIDDVREEKFGYEKEYRKLEAEVGPIKYIAEFIYGEEADNNLLEAAVRWVIIIIIIVFDPLAVLLLIASQYSFEYYRKDKGGSLPPKTDPDPEPEGPKDENNRTEVKETLPEGTKSDSTPQDGQSKEEPPQTDPVMATVEEPVKPTLSKKKTDQYLLWPDVDPDPIETRYIPTGFEEIEDEPYVDPNQMELDFTAKPDKGYVQTANPFFYDNEARQVKEKQASQKSQNTISEQLEQINDLDSWNEWVDAANKAAEEEPEDTFKQNSEQSESSTWAKINEARQNVDPEKLKELTISEEQYRDASQQHIINLINRLKKGLITVSDLSESEANKITKLLKEETSSGQN